MWPRCNLTYLECCKVDDAVNVGMRSKDLVQCLLICDVGFVEFWSFSADQLDAVQGDLGRVVEAVDDDNLVAMFEKGQSREGPDVARASVLPAVSVFELCNVRMAGSWRPAPR